MIKEYTDVYNPITKDVHNQVIKIDDNNYISYLIPNANVMLSTFASDNPDIGETALVTKEPWNCLILNGDHRKEYSELIDQGYEACYNYYISKPEFKSSWSD